MADTHILYLHGISSLKKSCELYSLKFPSQGPDPNLLYVICKVNYVYVIIRVVLVPVVNFLLRSAILEAASVFVHSDPC